MRRSKFTEAQIAMALRQGEAGTPVADIRRKLGISQATYPPLESVDFRQPILPETWYY